MRANGPDSLREPVEAAEDRPEQQMGDRNEDRRPQAIVQRQKPWWLELPARGRSLMLAGHVGMDARKNAHPDGQEEAGLHEAHERALPPGGVPPSLKHHDIEQREEPAVYHVH